MYFLLKSPNLIFVVQEDLIYKSDYGVFYHLKLLNTPPQVISDTCMWACLDKSTTAFLVNSLMLQEKVILLTEIYLQKFLLQILAANDLVPWLYR